MTYVSKCDREVGKCACGQWHIAPAGWVSPKERENVRLTYLTEALFNSWTITMNSYLSRILKAEDRERDLINRVAYLESRLLDIHRRHIVLSVCSTAILISVVIITTLS